MDTIKSLNLQRNDYYKVVLTKLYKSIRFYNVIVNLKNIYIYILQKRKLLYDIRVFKNI